MKSEPELRAAVKASREEGFRQIFQQYSGYVYAIVWNRISGVGTREDAEECVSDIFSDIFLQFDRIEEGKLQSYIRTVTKRTAIDKFRSLSASPDTVSIEEQEMQEVLSELDVEQEYDAADLRRVLLDKIKALGEPDTSIVMMKYYYELKSDEIAKTVRMSPAAVRMRLSRAMKRLKKLLSNEEMF